MKLFVLSQDHADSDTGSLPRSLNLLDVVFLGVGAIVGAGIFTTLGTAAAGNAVRPGAGPSLVLSFLITAVVCSFTAMCYAELAAMVPVSGSAYTYAYAAMGELFAWVIGWDLILEYAISNVAVAISWSTYMQVLLKNFGLALPAYLVTDWRTAASIPGFLATVPHVFGIPIVFNVLAFGIVMLLSALVVWGIHESAQISNVLVSFKIIILLFFVGVALWCVPLPTMQLNWQPFFPNGIRGTLAGAAIVFFAFVGFDSVSTVSEETKNPGRNIPLGIILSLVVCTVLYLLVTVIFTGVVPFSLLTGDLVHNQAEPLTLAISQMNLMTRWPHTLIAFGVVVAETTALLSYQIAQPRILFAMARDGLLPQLFARIHAVYKTPYLAIWLSSLFIAITAGLASIDEMVDLTNIGTLFAFALVCLAVPILRWRKPQALRPFRIPGGNWLIPLCGSSSCLALMWFLPPASSWRFLAWLLWGLVVYVLFGYRHSLRGQQEGRRLLSWAQGLSLSLSLTLVAIGLMLMPHHLGALTMLVHWWQATGDLSNTWLGCTCMITGLVGLLLTWIRL